MVREMYAGDRQVEPFAEWFNKTLGSQLQLQGIVFESLHTLMLPVPTASGQERHRKCAAVHLAVNENLAIHRESHHDCTSVTCGVLRRVSGLYAELRCLCVQVCLGQYYAKRFEPVLR